MDDFGEVTNAERRAWVARVEEAARAGWLFRTVFMFESRALAYTRAEFEEICRESNLRIIEFKRRDVFFVAKMVRA